MKKQIDEEFNKNIDSNKMNLKPTYVMNNDTLRKQISEILVKYGMPTRQAAISEIMTLFTQHQERVIERLEEEKVDIRPEIKVWLTHQTREEATVHNQTLDKSISIIREEMK